MKYICTILITLIISVVIYLLSIVDFNFFEFKLSIKTILGQELTFEELKESKIYRNYNMIEQGITIGELNKMFNEKGQPNDDNLATLWKLPYGSFGVLGYNENIRVIHKGIHIKNPPTRKINEDILYNLLDCKTLYDVNSIFGETPMQTGMLWDSNGNIEIVTYCWYIKTNMTENLTRKMNDINIKKGDIYFRFDYEKVHKKGKYKIEVNVSNNKKINIIGISKI